MRGLRECNDANQTVIPAIGAAKAVCGIISSSQRKDVASRTDRLIERIIVTETKGKKKEI